MKQVLMPGLFWRVTVYFPCPWVATQSGLEKPVNISTVTRKSKHSVNCTLLSLQVLSLFFIISHNLLCLISYKSPMQSQQGGRPLELAPHAGLTASKSLNHGQGPSDRVQRADLWHEPGTCVFIVVLPYKS